jgi:hypothetical protein
MTYEILKPRVPFRKYGEQTSYGEIFGRMGADCIISGKEMYAGCVLED